jgi:energy-coupling factor transport system substrate-specific component
MSWQLGAFLLLGVALGAGFAWYERQRPDARVVALVGTLAAFAALGRVAFAALPNIKPTTDIVLVSGYALGGAPGFVVGAVAALASNFFFGQGPWTPWQMVGWGATGMIGAGLALLTRRGIGRWPLAIVCFVVGFAFTALQDLGDWVNYSDHSFAQLVLYVGKGAGFDLIHAGGCLLFALAFGPSLLRSLQRFRRRMEVTWRELPPDRRAASGSPLAPLLIVSALIGAGGVALAVQAAAPPAARAAGTPTSYLLAAQNADGGFGGALGGPSSPLFSGWAALALAAAGNSPQAVSRSRSRSRGRTLLDYLEASAAGGNDPGSLERTILALRAAGASVSDAHGSDLLSALQRDLRADGSVSEQTNLTAFAVLALRAAGVAPRAASIAWLARQQDADGGFNFATAPGTSDVDDTGAVLEALADTGRAAAIARALAFIRSQQNSDGGFPSQAGASSNAQSTAFAVQGLIAAGVDPATLHRHGAPSPPRYLASLIAPDGHVRYAAGSDVTPVWVTAQALLALAGKPLPLAALGRGPGAHHNAGTAASTPAANVAPPARGPAPAANVNALMRLAGLLESISLAPIDVT